MKHFYRKSLYKKQKSDTDLGQQQNYLKNVQIYKSQLRIKLESSREFTPLHSACILFASFYLPTPLN